MFSRVLLFFLFIFSFLNVSSQTEEDGKSLIVYGRLSFYKVEMMPNSKYKYRTVFVFRESEKKCIEMNVPCDSSMMGAIFFNNYQCFLKTDSTYKIILEKVLFSTLPEGMKSWNGFYYTHKYIASESNGKFTLRQDVKESRRDKNQLLTEFVDIDSSLYRVVSVQPEYCYRLRN
jgi:hypothetical protein